jgi:hypothetical protein
VEGNREEEESRLTPSFLAGATRQEKVLVAKRNNTETGQI